MHALWNVVLFANVVHILIRIVEEDLFSCLHVNARDCMSSLVVRARPGCRIRHTVHSSIIVWNNGWMTNVKVIQAEDGRGLSLEIVATKSIAEGEEVFVDYGLSWEIAWDQHVKRWKPPVYPSNEWTSARQLNEELKPLDVAPGLSVEHLTTDGRGSLFTGCYYYEDDEDFWNSFGGRDMAWRRMAKDQLFHKFGRTYGEDFAVDENARYSDGSFWPCIVIDKDESESDEETTYTVRIIQSQFQKETVWNLLKLPRIISNYPRNAIRHFYLPYKSDIHLPGVFRHHIELPSHLVPDIWKDRTRA